jgi:hypothetical protein
MVNQYTGPRNWSTFYSPQLGCLLERGYYMGFGAGSLAKAYKLKSNDVSFFLKARLGRLRTHDEAQDRKTQFYVMYGKPIMHLSPEEIKQYIEKYGERACQGL